MCQQCEILRAQSQAIVKELVESMGQMGLDWSAESKSRHASFVRLLWDVRGLKMGIRRLVEISDFSQGEKQAFIEQSAGIDLCFRKLREWGRKNL